MSQGATLVTGRGKGNNVSARLFCLCLLLSRLVTTETHLYPSTLNLAHNQYVSNVRQRTNYYEALREETTTSYHEQYRTAQTLNHGSDGGDSSNKESEKKKKHKHYKQSNQERRSNRHVKKQRRASAWQQSQANLDFKDQNKQFDRGKEKFRQTNRPTIDDLIASANMVTRRSRRKNKKHDLRVLALDFIRQEKIAKGEVQKVEEKMQKGQVGKVPKHKQDDTVRLYFENFNSLSVFVKGKFRRAKIRRLRRLLKQYGADVLAGVETQTDWRCAEESEKFDSLFGQGKERRSVVGYNKSEEKISRSQAGGAAMMAIGRVKVKVMDTGVDETDLGRWCWIKLGGGGKTTYVATVYVPCIPTG